MSFHNTVGRRLPALRADALRAVRSAFHVSGTLILIMALLFSPAFFSSAYAADTVDLTEEDKAQLSDAAEAFGATLTETQGDMTKVQSRYEWIVDNYGNHHYPKILSLINTLDRAGFRKYTQGALDTLTSVKNGFEGVLAAKDDYDKAKAFMDRYRPDRNNPMRSLEQIGNALEDLNKFIEKIDPTGGVQTKPIREIIGFYREATTAYANALKRIGEKIQRRAGNGIGEGIPGDSDKDRSFLQQFPGVTAYRYKRITYKLPGSDREAAEFWEDQGGRAFVWRDGQWDEIRCGIGGLQTVFDGLFLANGTRPDLHTLLAAGDVDPSRLTAAQKKAGQCFDLLFGENGCTGDILSLRQIQLGRLSRKQFVATYIFDPAYTKKIDPIIEQIKNSVLVQGRVVRAGPSGSGIQGARISAGTPGGEVTAVSEYGGWFSLLIDMAPAGGRYTAGVHVRAPGYADYQNDWPLQGQCNQWYSIRLQESTVQVPDLMGRTAAQSMGLLEDMGLVPEKISGGAPPDAANANRVTWQSPAENQQVPHGSTVSFRAYDQWSAPVQDSPETGEEIAVTVRTPEEETTPDAQDMSEETDTGLAGYDGGLFISGPATMVAGENTIFSACDGRGKRYPASGNFVWHSTMEDTLVLGRSGNPVRGSVHKAGSATILLKYDGGSAWFDITIQARVPDVTGMSHKQAVGAIEQLNLMPAVTDSVASENPLIVKSQNPAAGTLVDAGTRIALRLAPGEPKDLASEDSLFSMAGGEKVTETDSMFSMSGGEKVTDDPEPPATGGTGISLLGEDLDNSRTPPATDRSDQPPQDTGAPTLQMVYPQQHVENRYGFHDRYWHVRVKLNNVPPETVVEKRPYLVIRLDDRTHYAHYYNTDTRTFECIVYATARTGVRRLHISCEGLNRIPDLKKDIVVGEIPANYKSRFVKGCDLARVAEARQRYESARRESRNDPDRVMQAHLYYARSLQSAADAHAELNRYQEAVNLITEAKTIFETYKLTKTHHQKNYYSVLGSYSDIMREVLKDRQAYLQMIRHEIAVLMQLQKTIYTDNHRMIYQIVMGHAEQLLTFGLDKSDVAPFVRIGLNNMTERERTNFVTYKGREKEYNGTYSGSMQSYFNCAELFVKQN